MKRLLATAIALCATTVFAVAAHNDVLTDSIGVNLREVKVTASGGRMARIDRKGALSLGRAALEHAPRMFGEADALRLIQTLPGVGSAGDYSGGISIDGMGHAQNEYRLNGIPVHFPYHFGGMASVFHPRMFDRVRVGKSIHEAGATDVIGGRVDVSSSSGIGEPCEGEVNVGMIASSGYLRVPLGERWAIAAAARKSYINALYGPLLKDGQMQASYGFGDFDVVINGDVSERDRIEATVHYNTDNVEYDDGDYSLLTSLKWSNLVSGIGWEHDGDVSQMNHRVWFSRFSNSLGLDMTAASIYAPTAVKEFGARGEVLTESIGGGLNLDAGYSVRHCILTPQRVETVGIGNNRSGYETDRCATAAKLWGTVGWEATSHWRFDAGLEGAMVWGEGGYRSQWVDPRLSVTFGWRRGYVTIHGGSYHQWLHQVGFSEMGMSTDFRLGPSAEVPVEHGLNVAATLSQNVCEGVMVNADMYFKRITGEPEYIGAVLDIVNSDYVAERYVFPARGYNVGVNLSARLTAGNVSAMASYGYCLGRRKFAGDYFNATGILSHVGKLTASWRIDSHWTVSGIMNVASGRPYTPVKAVYFIGERLMMEYGARNSARLPAYHRLDAGADYEFHTGSRHMLTHRINLSVVNLYGQKNVEMRTFTVNTETGRYVRRDISSLYRMLPSVSYTLIW